MAERKLMGDDYAPSQPETGPVGHAVKLNGVISLRTASSRPFGAMINGLCLFFGLDPAGTGHWTDEMIEETWKRCVTSVPNHDVQIVPVVCTETVS